jgi:hypothetical protein
VLTMAELKNPNTKPDPDNLFAGGEPLKKIARGGTLKAVGV